MPNAADELNMLDKTGSFSALLPITNTESDVNTIENAARPPKLNTDNKVARCALK